MIERVKEALDVHVEHPPSAHVEETLIQDLESVMRRATGLEAVREVVEALLVDRLQEHRHRTLEDLVLERRDPDGARLRPVPFRDVDPPDRRRPVHTGLRPVQERVEVTLQVLGILGGRLTVDADRSVLSGASKRLQKPLEVHVVRQRAQRCLWHLLRQFRYPRLFR